MHYILATFGTDGDIMPLVGLGVSLHARGHHVTLVANEHVRPLAEGLGLSFESLIADREYREILSHPDMWHPVKSALVGARWAMQFLDRQYELLERISRSDDCILVASPAVFAARMVQEKRAIPLVSIVLQPWMVVSLTAPPVMAGGLSLPAWAPPPVGKVYWRCVNAVGDLLVGRRLNQSRIALGLAPVRKVFDHWLSPDLVLGLFPDWYGPPQKDWPLQMRLSGFPLFDGNPDPDKGLDPSLQSFCQADSPPVAVTFGTGMLHGSELFRTMVEVSEQLGCRTIFLTRHSLHLPNALPENIRQVDYAPFCQLFPLCSAVVHHGGIGTTSQAMAAGIPQLILPMAYDQYDNGTRVKSLGVGTWLKPGKRKVNVIVKGLRDIQSKETSLACRSLAVKLQNAKGLGNAADLIEAL